LPGRLAPFPVQLRIGRQPALFSFLEMIELTLDAAKSSEIIRFSLSPFERAQKSPFELPLTRATN
jgi:hypothetical protein